MTKVYKLLFRIILFQFLFAFSLQGQVILSELVDPKQEFNSDRYIEIYNLGFTDVVLDGWKVIAIGNGADIHEWMLSGTIGPHEALVCGDATTSEIFQVDFGAEDWSDHNGTWNGKSGDGARLMDGSAELVDFVLVGSSLFENQKMERKPDVSTPVQQFDPQEWTSTALEYAVESNPGFHFSIFDIPAPDIGTAVTDIPFPYAQDEVHVSVEVTSDTGMISEVDLSWGWMPDQWEQTITMGPGGGDLFVTSHPIPPQNPGTILYFRVHATNDIGGAAEGLLQTIGYPQPLLIRELQGESDFSPYVDQYVEIRGIVTSSGLADFSIQDQQGAWNAVWVLSDDGLVMGDSLVVRGKVTESHPGGMDRTSITDAIYVSIQTPVTEIDPVPVGTGQLSDEKYEAVLLVVDSAVYEDAVEYPEIDDGSGIALLDDRLVPIDLVQGSTYEITGVVDYRSGSYLLTPRQEQDMLFVADLSPAQLESVRALNATTVQITFSEDVEEESALNKAHYQVDLQEVLAVVRNSPRRVRLTTIGMTEGQHELHIDGVKDLFGNPMMDVGIDFDFVDTGVPAGYYDPAEGLEGLALHQTLHDIIDDHNVRSYSFAWTAFRSTDDKPNGKVWDIYSDIPGGIAPYEYEFGADEGGPGNQEGLGYTREHSFPQSWFGGEVLPMHTDLFALYPCDAHVNGRRGSFPYGEVSNPDYISQNGSKLGQNVTAGYSGIVFEPIDEYKGDLARSYFYMSTRYLDEDASWPGSEMATGAELEDWAVELLLDWAEEDPVSPKEIERNHTIYGFQGNRNPFIDRPEFVELIWDQPSSTVDLTYEEKVLIYPNPVIGNHMNTTLGQDAGILIFAPDGSLIYSCPSDCLPGMLEYWKYRTSGIYTLIASEKGRTYIQRIVVSR